MAQMRFDPKRMDALRNARGWSDLRLADEAGIHPDTLKNWRVRKNCSRGVASTVAVALGVQMSDLAQANGRTMRQKGKA